MAVLTWSTRYGEMNREARIAWNWLRKLPRYRKDYGWQEKMGTSIDIQLRNELKLTYGFYPLISPNEKLGPSRLWAGFVHDFSKYMGQNILDTGVKIKNVYDSDKSKPKLKRILFEVDPSRPTTYLVARIGDLLKEIKDENKIEDVRQRVDNLSGLYKIKVLQSLGATDHQKRSTINGIYVNDEHRESKVKKYRRLIKRAELKRTEKM